MTNAALVLFSLRECPHCQAAREYLRARGVPFVERDVREEAGAVHDLTKLTGECIVPTLSLAGDVQVGWDAVRVGAMLDDPLPPEEEDRLLAIIEETTGQDFGAGALTLPPPLPQQFDTVPSSTGTSVVLAEVPAGASWQGETAQVQPNDRDTVRKGLADAAESVTMPSSRPTLG